MHIPIGLEHKGELHHILSIVIKKKKTQQSESGDTLKGSSRTNLRGEICQ